MTAEDEASADALLSLLLDSIPDYIYFKDRDRRFVRASRAFEELLGLGPGEIIGKRDEDVFPPAMTENTIPDDLRVIEQGEPVLKRIEGGRSPAGERYVSTTKLPWRSATGEIIGLYGVSKDVTDLVLAQRQREQTILQLQNLIGTLPGFVWLTDTDGVLLEVNRLPLEVGGVRSEQVLGEPLADGCWWRHDDAARARLHAGLVAATAGGETRYEDQLHHTSGAVLDVDMSFIPLRTPEGAVSGVIVFGVDVTRRNQMTRALRDNEEHLRLSLEAAGQGTWTLDMPEFRSTHDAADARLLGYPLASFRHRDREGFARLLHPDDRDETLATYDACVAGDVSTYEAEFRLRTASGGWKWILAKGKCVAYDEQGTPLRMLGTHTDIDARKQAEQAMREHAVVQEMLVEEINHRVRNNLASILGMLGAEHAREQGDPRATDAVLDDLERRIRSIAIAHDILTEHHWCAFPLAELCERVIRATALGSACGDAVAVEISPASRPVDPASAHHIALVLAELTTNTLKHGRRADTQLQIRVEIDRPGQATIRYRDNGPGYPAAILDGHRSSGRSGLGINLVRGIVHHTLRGELSLASDDGAVVEIWLDRQPPSSAGAVA